MTPISYLLTCWLSSVRLRSVSITSSALAASIRPALNAETLTHATEYAKTCTHTTCEGQRKLYTAHSFQPSPHTGRATLPPWTAVNKPYLCYTFYLLYKVTTTRFYSLHKPNLFQSYGKDHKMHHFSASRS